MAKLTRSQIAYDLTVSPHRETIPYEGTEITYVFSSDLYRRKFLQKLEQNRETIEESLSKRFGFRVVPGVIADLRLYRTTEKRGFLLVKDGVSIECENKVVLDGVSLTLTSSAE